MNVPTPLPEVDDDRETTSLSRVSTVLLADPDRVTRRFVELSLPELCVQAVASAAQALDRLSRVPTDLIISGTRLVDADGVDLCRRLSREARFRDIPFLMLSSDQRAETKTGALEAGVADYLIKPCDPRELAARVAAHIARARANRTRAPSHSALAGELEALALPDLLGVLEWGRRSGVLDVVTPVASGQVFVDAGRVVHAVFGNIAGPAAFHYLMAETSGRFEFRPSGAKPDQHTIDCSVSALVLESARVLDEVRAGKPIAETTAPKLVAPPRAALVAAPPATPDDARALLHGITDGWSPGHLQLLARSQLREWSRAATGALRFHVHLVTTAAIGVPALMSIAAPPTDDALVAALGGEPRALTVTMRLRLGRVLDVLLLDLHQLEPWVRALDRAPSLTVIAPPGGDALAFGAQVLVGLDQLFARLPPAGIVTAGGASLAALVGDLDRVRAAQVPVHAVDAALGDDAGSLRRVLDRGIRRWGGLR